MGRLSLAFRCFITILFDGAISDEDAEALGLRPAAAAAPAPAAPGAPAPQPPKQSPLQLLAILQRDARLVDFIMEDISAYGDEQIGAAVRTLHDDCAKALTEYVELGPVIDRVEGEFTRLEGPEASAGAASIKFLGNVPAQGRPSGGVLRHRGWRAVKVDLPPVAGDPAVLAPAEIEVQ